MLQQVMTSQERFLLHQNLTKYFREGELRTVVFYLGLDYDDLEGQGKADKARELVSHLERCGRVTELIYICSKLRPNVSWQYAPGD